MVSDMKKVSIIILNWNTCELTCKCLRTVRKHTDYPYEVVLVDNGSTDGSKEILKKFESKNTKVLLLEKNHGFAGGNNKGMEIATGDLICLLNSDAFVTRDWLCSMVDCMKQTGAGMVGPWTNRAKGLQRHKAKYKLIPKFIRRPKSVDYLSFFCVLIDNKVIDVIGNLDEGFGLGTYEDDDFCRRAIEAGFKLVIDARSWVWHLAHATMTANDIDEQVLLNRGESVFRSKWSK